MSMLITSGRNFSTSSMASMPLRAWPITSMSGAFWISVTSWRRWVTLSSTTNTRIGATGFLPRPYQLADCLQQFALVKIALDDVSVCSGLEALRLVLLGVQRCDQDHRQLVEALVLPHFGRQLEAVHERHFHVGHHQRADGTF